MSKDGRSPLVFKFKTNTVGGSPTASHFLLLRQKESNQRKGDPGLPPFGFPRYFANKRGCATRPSEAHKTCLTAELKQCSPKPPLAGEISRRRTGEGKAKIQKTRVGTPCPPFSTWLSIDMTNDMTKQVPFTLYKYLEVKEFLPKILNGEALKFSCPYDFNDPFESRSCFQIEDSEEGKRYIRGMVEKRVKNLPKGLQRHNEYRIGLSHLSLLRGMSLLTASFNRLECVVLVR